MINLVSLAGGKEGSSWVLIGIVTEVGLWISKIFSISKLHFGEKTLPKFLNISVYGWRMLWWLNPHPFRTTSEKERSVLSFFWCVLDGHPYPMTIPQVLAAQSWDLQPLADTEPCRWLFLPCLSSPGGVSAADDLQTLVCDHWWHSWCQHTVLLNRINCSALPSSDWSNLDLSCNFSLRNWVWCSIEGDLHHRHVRSHLMAVHGYLPTTMGFLPKGKAGWR